MEMADGFTSVELPNSIHQQLMMQGIAAHQIAMQDTELAFARNRDVALYDLRVLGSVSASELLVTNDPMQVAGYNTAIRTPTTIDHPSAVVGTQKPA